MTATRSRGGSPEPFDPRSEVELKPFPWTGLTLFVVVVALVAVVAVPQRHPSAEELHGQRMALEARMALGEMRAAIREYQFDHGRLPGVPPARSDRLVVEVASAAWLRRQLTMRSAASGETVPQDLPTHPFGPYLDAIPRNPVNLLDTVRVLRPGERMPLEPAGEHGFIYDPRSGRLRMDARGAIPGSEELYFEL